MVNFQGTDHWVWNAPMRFLSLIVSRGIHCRSVLVSLSVLMLSGGMSANTSCHTGIPPVPEAGGLVQKAMWWSCWHQTCRPCKRSAVYVVL